MIVRADRRIVWPVSAVWPGRLPAIVWSTPKLLRIRRSEAISASLGTLMSSSVSSVSREAIISGKAAFLAPEIGIVPLRGAPPRMRMRSIGVPLGPCRPPSIFGTLGGDRPVVGLAPFGRRSCLSAPRLNLAPLQVFPKRRLQAVGPGFRFGIGHDFTRPIVAAMK